MMKKRSFLRNVWILLLTAALLTGCAGSASGTWTPSDDIISYKKIDSSKTVLTVGKYLAADTEKLEAALEAKFPDIDFVFTDPDAGDNDIAYMKMMSEHGSLEDIQFCVHRVGIENDFLYDLSGEACMGQYNLTSLDSMNVGGKVYQLPVSNTLVGIAYNKTLFDEHGWQVPSTLEEFYTLCETIQKAGIRAFAPCLKYYSVLESTAFGLSFDKTFRSASFQVKYRQFLNQQGSCRGALDPAFLAMKDLYDRGLINADDFEASATEERQDLYDGKIAMMTSNISIAAFTDSEKPAAEISMFGFPTETPDERWMQMVPGSLLSVSAVSMKDAKKKEAILKVLDYFTTEEGQTALLQCIPGVSSLASYEPKDDSLYAEAREAITKGQVFFADYYASNDFVPEWKKYLTGETTLDAFITANDSSKPADYLAALSETPIGKASADFTVLDTSIYNADVMREASGAQIALILNGYFYTGNLARIFAGDIVLPNRFVLKSVSAKNYLTTYGISGAHLKKLLEHPIINGSEVNALYAVSGLKVTYAPWADADANVVKVTLSDSTEIDDAATYQVTAWAGSIDASYIDSTVKEFPDLGMNKDIMTAAIQKAGTIAPVRDGRIKLVWK